jgi:nitroreductase
MPSPPEPAPAPAPVPVEPALDLATIMRTARAVRRFRPDPVPPGLLLECLEAATWAPSGSNEQAWRFCVLRSPEVRALLGPAYRRGWARTAAVYGIERPAADDDSRRARMLRSIFDLVEHFEDVPVYVLFCAVQHAGFPPLFTGASIYPALQNFLLAARQRGLGGVITTWFTECEAELRQLVGVPDGWVLAALVPVGFPLGRPGPVRRTPVERVVCWDRWDRTEPPGPPGAPGPVAP